MAIVTPDARMERVDGWERAIIDALGTAGALEAISAALSYDAKESIYGYIMRCHDIETGDDT